MSVKNPDPTDIHVGNRIRALRLARGKSQVALAEALGVSFQQVQKYEKGVNRVGAGRLTSIAAFLETDVTQFFTGGPSKAVGKPVDDPVAVLGLTRRGVRLARAFLALNPELAERIVAMVEAAAASAAPVSRAA